MLRCNFCGKETGTIIRIVIAKDYDRLSVKHDIKDACPECSDKKEREKKQEIKK